MNNLNKILVFFIVSLLISAPLYAYDHTFTVSGEDEVGNSIEGVIYFNNGENSISGTITDENGRINEFTGKWGARHVWSYVE